MRVERFYHSAPSSAETSVDIGRGIHLNGADIALFERAFPRGVEAAAYALKKRLICPRWWLVGVMSQWLAKDSDALSLQLGLKDGDWLLSGPAVSVKHFPLIVSLWTEIFAQFAKINAAVSYTLELDLSRILKGTALEVSQQHAFLTDYLSSALRVLQVREVLPKGQGKRSKIHSSARTQLTLNAVGLVQIVENVVLKRGSSHMLSLTFSRDPRKLLSDEVEELLPSLLRNGDTKKTSELSVGCDAIAPALVSLQPDVLQALSRSVSPKKMCSYLALELMKAKEAKVDSHDESAVDAVWCGRTLGLDELSKLHKEQLARAQTFYDHGILSWENEAPRQRVRSLAGRSLARSESGIVHCWRMSQHALDAFQFERALSAAFRENEFSCLAAPAAERMCVTDGHENQMDQGGDDLFVSQIDRKNLKESFESSMKQASQPSHSTELSPQYSDAFSAEAPHSLPLVKDSLKIRKDTVQLILQDESNTRQVVSKQNQHSRPSVWSDDEFLMCVAEFYESLTPLQQQAFERERKKMSPEQFKKYVTPALLKLRYKA